MAKRQSRKAGVPLFFATVAYKLWVQKELEDRSWSYPRLMREIKNTNHNVSCSAAALHQLIVGKPEEKPLAPSNTEWMPAINRALGIDPPEIFDPTKKRLKLDARSRALLDRLAAKLATMTERERRMLEAMAAESDDTSK